MQAVCSWGNNRKTWHDGQHGLHVLKHLVPVRAVESHRDIVLHGMQAAVRCNLCQV